MIVGANAPKTADIGSLAASGCDLSEYGRRREAACLTLAQAALASADANGTFRIASMESTAALLILETLLEPLEVQGHPVSAHPCRVSYIGHVQYLGNGSHRITEKMEEDAIGLTAYGRECLVSATTGRPPSFSDEDYIRIRLHMSNECKVQPKTLAEAIAFPEPGFNIVESFYSLFDAFMAEVAAAASFAAENLTRMRARKAPLNLIMMEAHLDRLSSIKRFLPDLITRAHLCTSLGDADLYQTCGMHPDHGVGYLWRHLRAVRFGTHHQKEGYWKRLGRLWERAKGEAFEAARALVGILTDASAAGAVVGSLEFLDGKLQALFYDDVVFWASLLIKTPATEQGGPPAFGLDTKISELKIILHSLYSLQWFQARQQYTDAATWLKGEIATLELERASTFAWEMEMAGAPITEDVFGSGEVEIGGWGVEALRGVDGLDDFGLFAPGEMAPGSGSADSPPAPSGASSEDSQMKHGVKIHSCAPCRIRRVKCERVPGADASVSCVKCTAKGIAYIFVHGAASSPEEDADTQWEAFGTCYLARTELKSSLLTSLLEEFLAGNYEPLTRSANFQESFDNAGRRFDLLTGQTQARPFPPPSVPTNALTPPQVLCSTILALAAYTSSNPLIIGPGAPNSWEIDSAALQGRNLAEFGRNRLNTCVTLTEAALAGVDQHGTLRTCSRESLVALLILEYVVESLEASGHVFTSSGSATRAITAAYSCHFRELLDGGENFDPVIVHTISGRDGLVSATTGRPQLLTEDDLDALERWHAKLVPPAYPPPLKVAMVRSAFPEPDNAFGSVFDSLLLHVSAMARFAGHHFSRKRARAAPLSLDLFTAYLDDTSLALSASLELSHRSAILESLNPLEMARLLYVKRHIRGIRFAACYHAFLASRIAKGRVEERDKVPSLEGASRGGFVVEEGSVDGYWQRVEALKERAGAMAFQAVRQVAALVQETLQSGETVGSIGFLDWGLQPLYFDDVQTWTSILVDMPATEQGGPPGFGFETKINEMEAILRALYSLQWYQARPRYADATSWLEQQVALVKAQRDLSVAWEALIPSSGAGALPLPLPMELVSPSTLSMELELVGGDEVGALLSEVGGLSGGGEVWPAQELTNRALMELEVMGGGGGGGVHGGFELEGGTGTW
ncbi:Zn(2)-C7 fungal-type transcription factor [Pseudohyphozyma bogoriensis]|nr:Zn(2)-C7 fungal-type transcription factor [Pseudohyphozyma bogoriensis]